MISSIQHSGRPWQEWEIREWNDALFEHFFRAPEGDSVPVSRLVVNADVLQRVTGDVQTPPKEIRAGFRNVVLRRLHQTGQSLCTDAASAEWASRHSDIIPPYFAHLLVTCFAASGTGDSVTPKNDFRKRLNRFLGRGEDNARYTLGKLPRLWEMLQSWLAKAVDSGRPYRTLILAPQPSNIRLIGYSLALSFPAHRDQKALVALFQNKDLPSPPPVVVVLRTIETHVARFGNRFQQAFREFCKAFLDRDAELYQRPFWSAVCDAIATASQKTKRVDDACVAHAVLRLEREADWKFGLTIFLDKPISQATCNGLTTLPADDFGVREFPYILSLGPETVSSTPLVELLLSGSLRTLLSLSADNLARAVGEGILLFVPDEEDIWLATYSLPHADSIRALVRSDLAPTVLAALSALAGSIRHRDSRYSGWIEIEGLSGKDLRNAKLAEKFPHVICLQETIDAPRINVRGGVRLPNGWLGRRAALPEFTVDPPNARVTLEGIGPEAKRITIPARGDSDRPGTFSVPIPPDLPLDLAGEYVVRALVGDKTAATRRVEFRSHVLSADYRVPSQPEDWLCEAGVADIAVVGENGQAADKVSAASIDRLLLTLPEGLSPEIDESPSREVASLTEILAGLALRRKLISAADLADWFGRVLGVQGKLIWDTIRAWVEAGALDALVYRRWRGRAYVVRRPRFVVSGRPTDMKTFAVLQGLAPLAIEREIERAAKNLGAIVERYRPAGTNVLVPLVLRARSISIVEAVSTAAGIEPPELLPPIGSCVDQVDCIAEIRSDLRKNHVLAGYWQWHKGTFLPSPPQSEITVEWYRRDDVPDAYVVRKNDELLWHSLSRTWALLVAANHRKTRPFRASGPCRLTRELPGLHLPVPIGRWASASCGICPVPSNDQRAVNDYVYSFCGSSALSQAENALWKRGLPLPAQLVARGRHLISLLSAKSFTSEPVAAIPSWVRRLFELHSAALGCGRLSHVARVPRRLLPGVTGFAEAVRRETKDN